MMNEETPGKNNRKAIAMMLVMLSVWAALAQIERKNRLIQPNSGTLHIYVPCSPATKLAELTVLIDGKVAAEKTLRYGGPQPCIDELTVVQPAGQHEIQARSGLPGASAPGRVSIKPGENWIVISRRRAAGGSWEWVIEQHPAQPEFS